MEQPVIGWRNVLFGAAITAVVAIAPMVFVLMSGAPATAADSNAGSHRWSSGVDTPILVLVVAVAVAALVAGTIIGVKAERARR